MCFKCAVIAVSMKNSNTLTNTCIIIHHTLNVNNNILPVLLKNKIRKKTTIDVLPTKVKERLNSFYKYFFVFLHRFVRAYIGMEHTPMLVRRTRNSILKGVHSERVTATQSKNETLQGNGSAFMYAYIH